MSDPRAKSAGDGARVSVFVAVALEDAFEVFTEEIDLWWKQGPAFRIAGKRPGTLHFEPGVGGRLFESVQLGSGERVFEVGKITAWEPPQRFSFEWRAVNFKPDEKTFVDVRFDPQGEGTLVSVHHYGFAALPDDHPVRHGARGATFSRNMGQWWAALMTGLREHVAAARSPKLERSGTS